MDLKKEGRVVSIGAEEFSRIRESDFFYVDKTDFISVWWRRGAAVTLLTRPRRFGKSLMLDTVMSFFSQAERNQAQLFSGLRVWQDKAVRELAGTLPVVKISFAGVKADSYDMMRSLVTAVFQELVEQLPYLKKAPELEESERSFFAKFGAEASDADVTYFLRKVCQALHKVHGAKPIVLLDEYDTPMQEAWLNGYWKKASRLLRTLMNLTFKGNPSLNRAILTGITRVSKESIFSDLSNPEVDTVFSEAYSTLFGFTEAEVQAAMKEYGLSDFAAVKRWYDGFVFGSARDIYNPWSITSYLKNRKLSAYWANTSSNALAGNLIRTASVEVKQDFEELLNGSSVCVDVSEEIVFQNLQLNAASVWSLLLASGYLRVVRPLGDSRYELALTNLEVRKTFEGLIDLWFCGRQDSNYPNFVKALLACDVENMNFFINQLTTAVFSFFDAGKAEPEKFYHAFVLGLLVSLQGRYFVTSNRESGFGRYDVLLEPADKTKDEAYILEFKAKRPGTSGTLEDAVRAAHEQIKAKAYATELLARGMASERIHAYALVFDGKKVLIG